MDRQPILDLYYMYTIGQIQETVWQNLIPYNCDIFGVVIIGCSLMRPLSTRG